MHRILKTHLNKFCYNFGFESDTESVAFEKFSNYATVSARVPGQYDVCDITTSEFEDGIDGIAIIINEEIITSDDDAKSIFEKSKRNHDVLIIFIQSKTSDNFDLGDFLKFKEAVLRFSNQDNYTSPDSVLSTAWSIFDTILNNAHRIRNGKPSISARFITTGSYKAPKELESAKNKFSEQLKDTGLFNDVDVKFLGRDELTALWVGTYTGVSAKLEAFSIAALPRISGIEEAYLAVVKAKDLVEKLLITDDGTLRSQVFEENVRSFLGLENTVNNSISQTINSHSASRFPVLNNGITIASPDVRVQGQTLHLENFQIVNGCQTSNVLFENFENLNDDIMVNLKIVETSNEDVFSELVRATNSQSQIIETQFLSLRPIVKKVEQYFNSYEDCEGRLYFERRDRQYIGKDIPNIRIFSLHHATRCVASMFCNRPHLAFRYTKDMYEELTDSIFAEDCKEIVFYASCLTLYRFYLLHSNRTIPQSLRKFKWHILPIVRAILCGKTNTNLNSKKIEKESEQIINVMNKHSNQAVDVFTQATAVITSLGEISDDRLKRQTILAEMLEKVKS
jgi:hypothetical protein